MDQGGGVLELHTQELKMPHAMIMQDFGKWSRTEWYQPLYCQQCKGSAYVNNENNFKLKIWNYMVGHEFP